MLNLRRVSTVVAAEDRVNLIADIAVIDLKMKHVILLGFTPFGATLAPLPGTSSD